MRLSRKAKKYVNNYFVPSGLLVVISWVSKLGICYDKNFIHEYFTDKFCYTTRSCSWENGSINNINTSSCQFVHLCYIKISKYGFNDGNFKLDDCLYLIRITIFDGICYDITIQTFNNLQVF